MLGGRARCCKDSGGMSCSHYELQLRTAVNHAAHQSFIAGQIRHWRRHCNVCQQEGLYCCTSPPYLLNPGQGTSAWGGKGAPRVCAEPQVSAHSLRLQQGILASLASTPVIGRALTYGLWCMLMLSVGLLVAVLCH